MNNYLLQLLKEVKTLIIPGLGALTVTNESTGEIMFMPYLKFDDGTLAQHVSSKENMELNEAKNLIAKFVREVQAALDKGDSYDMYQFGSFKKVDGEITFEKWNDGVENVVSSTASEKEIIPEPIVEPEIVPEPEILPEPVKEPEIVPEPEIIPEPETIPEPEIQPKPEIVPEPEVIPEPIAEPTPEPVKEPEVLMPVSPEPVIQEDKTIEKTESSKNKEEKNAIPNKPKENKKVEKKAISKSEKPKKKTSVLAYVLWGVFTLIIGAAIFIFVKFDELKKDFPILADLAGESSVPTAQTNDSSTTLLSDEPEMNMDENTKSEPLPSDDIEGLESASNETSTVPEEKKTESVKPEKVIKPAPVKTAPKKTTAVKPKTSVSSSSVGSANMSLNYHIIAGSFGSESNAKRLASSLQAKGYSDAAVMQNNGMYRVSVKGFSSQSEAAGAAQKMQGDVPGAWVLKL